MPAAQMAKKPQMASEGCGTDCPHSPQRKALGQHLNLGLLKFQHCGKTNFCCVRYFVCSVLF